MPTLTNWPRLNDAGLELSLLSEYQDILAEARRIRRRETVLHMHGTSFLQLVNLSCRVEVLVHMICGFYLLNYVCSQYFALINFDVKLQFCDKASFPLLLILLRPK